MSLGFGKQIDICHRFLKFYRTIDGITTKKSTVRKKQVQLMMIIFVLYFLTSARNNSEEQVKRKFWNMRKHFTNLDKNDNT